MALTIEIFKAGRHTDMHGRTVAFSAADIDRMVASYDPALHEAPVVLGHPKHDAPAYGWVKSLKRKGTSLDADVDQLNPAFVEAVKTGEYKKRSASFYLPDSAANPKPGTWYLRHIGFLGAMPPSVKGLREVAFAGGADDCVELELGEGALDVALLFRSLRDWVLAKFGQEDADKALPPWDVNNTQAAGVIQAAQGDEMPSPSFAETPAPAAGATTTPAPAAPAAPNLDAIWAIVAALLPADLSDEAKAEAKKKLEASLKGEPPAEPAAPAPATADHSERERSITRREHDLRVREARMKHDAHASFLEGLVREGKPLPESRDALLGVMAILDGEPIGEVSFGEKDKRGPLAIFQAALERIRPEIDYSERAPADDDENEVDLSEEEIVRQAIVLQDEAAAKGQIITTPDAIRAVKKGKAK